MEYDVIPLRKDLVDITAQLKEKGEQGWDLITIVNQPSAFKANDKLSSYLAYFKKLSSKVT